MVGQAPLYQPFLPELPAQRGGHPAFLPLRVLSGWTDAPCSTAHPILQGGQTWFAVLPPAQTAWRFQPLRPASAVPENPVRPQHRQCGRQNCRWHCPDGRCCREGHRPAVPDNSARRGERFDNHSQKLLSFRYNIDTNRVEARFTDGSAVANRMPNCLRTSSTRYFTVGLTRRIECHRFFMATAENHCNVFCVTNWSSE